MSDGIRTGIFGRSGAGKSVLGNQILLTGSHALLFDYLPTRRPWARKHHFTEVTTIEDVKRVMAKTYGRGFRIWFRPQADQYAQMEALDRLSKLIFEIQGKRVDQDKPVIHITFAIDELSESYPVEKMPRSMQGFTRLCKAGRHYRISLIGQTQRPAQVSTEFRGNLDFRFFLSLRENADLEAVKKMAGKSAADLVAELPVHYYLRLDPDGNLTKGKTKLT